MAEAREVVPVLLEGGADPNATDTQKDQTPGRPERLAVDLTLCGCRTFGDGRKER